MRAVQNKYVHMFNKIVLLLKKKKEKVTLQTQAVPNVYKSFPIVEMNINI